MEREESLFDGKTEKKCVIIYGAHLVAKETYRCLKKRRPDIRVEAFAVTDTGDNPDVLEGVAVKKIADLKGFPNLYIVIAMPEKYHKEAVRTLEHLGFLDYEEVGLKRISILKGQDLVQAVNGNSNTCFLQESVNDYSWLDLFEKKDRGEKIEGRHYKFTILTRLSDEGLQEKLEKLDFKADYDRVLGPYRSLKGLKSNNSSMTAEKECSLAVYMVTCKNDKLLENAYQPHRYVHPLQAGTALTNLRKAELTDDKGANISEKNVSFAEMTAMYWIWKNAPSAEYKGLCHYRRHFEMNEEQAQQLEQNGIDAVLTTPRLVLNGLKNMFLSDTPVKEDVFQNMMDSIQEIAGEEYANYAKDYFDSIFYYPNNMVIAREKVFHDYCNWIFPILFCMERHDEEKHIVKRDRHIAFAAELLTSMYFSFHKRDLKIAVTDYLFLE